MKNFIVAFFAYLLPVFPLGFFWHMKTFAKTYEQLEIYRPKPIIPMGLASMAIQAALFSWLFPKLFNDASRGWFANGLCFSLTMGLLAWSFLVLPVAAKNRMTNVGKFVALETAFTAIQFLIVGPLIAWAHSL